MNSQTLAEYLQHAGPCPVLETEILGAPRINPTNMLGVRVMSTREKSNAGRGKGNIRDTGQDEGGNDMNVSWGKQWFFTIWQGSNSVIRMPRRTSLRAACEICNFLATTL